MDMNSAAFALSVSLQEVHSHVCIHLNLQPVLDYI